MFGPMLRRAIHDEKSASRRCLAL